MRNCDTFTDWQFQLQGLATYIIPRIEVQVSGTVLSRPGPAKSANVQVPAATIAASLGRPVSGNPSTVTINLFDTNEAFYPQITVVDMRVSKILRFRGIRANLGVDIYNLMNSSAGADLQHLLGDDPGDMGHAEQHPGGALREARAAVRFLIWKDLSIVSWLIDSTFVELCDAPRSPTPGLSSHPGVGRCWDQLGGWIQSSDRPSGNDDESL